MYSPPAFVEKDTELLWSVVRAQPLGLLVSLDEGTILANLIPFEVVTEGNTSILRAHLAKANGQWRSLEGQAVLIVFQGASAYVSPQWYVTKKEHGKVVPTWNYAVVQVRGRARVIDNGHWILAQVSRLTDSHEQGMGQGEAWKVSDAPDGFIQSQLKGLVGLEIDVSEITGKLKASQNRTAPDRSGVVEGLNRLGGDQNEAIAALIRNRES